MSYYKEQMEANRAIDDELMLVRKTKGQLPYDALVLRITSDYPVSQKHISKRVTMHEKTKTIRIVEKDRREFIVPGEMYDE